MPENLPVQIEKIETKVYMHHITSVPLIPQTFSMMISHIYHRRVK